jgi:pyruvate formate lyase activating enzyme
MKLCIFDIKRFALHDGPGIRTTVFFKGCPLECWWCHNPEGIQSGTEHFTEEIEFDGVRINREVKVGRWISVEDLMKELSRDRIYMDESGGGYSFSGGEPLQQSDALFTLLKLSREEGVYTTVDTSGYTSRDKMERLSDATDLIYYDLKSLDNEKHKKYTGVPNERILENFKLAISGSAEVVARIPLVTGFNADNGDMEDLRDYLLGFESLSTVDLLPYHPFGTNKYRRFNRENRQDGFGTPDKNKTEEIKNIFTDAGFQVRIGG